MHVLDRYILRQIALPFLFVSLTLVSVIWLTQALRILDRFVGNGVSFDGFLFISALLLPSLLAVVLPIALFCSVTYAYHRLTTDSELVVMWSAGVSRLRLAAPALAVATVTTVVLYAFSLWLIPLSTREFRTAQFEFRSNIANLLIREGEFNTPVTGLTVYVRDREQSGELLGILVHDNRDARRPVTMMAERGALVRSPEGPRFILVNGNRQAVDPESKQLSLLYFDSYVLDLDAFNRNESQTWKKPSERYLHELLWPDLSNADDRSNYWRLITQGHRNLSSPLTALALTLIALAATLAAEFSRRGYTRRLAIAAGCAIALEVGGLGIGNLADRSPFLIPLLYLNAIAFGAAALWLLARDGVRRGGDAGPAVEAPA